MNTYKTVDEFLTDLSQDRLAQVQKLRGIILNVEPALSEHIKWNSPSYVLDGEDRITFNMHYPDKTMVLIHMGATRKEDKKGLPVMEDKTGLITWNSNIRGTLTFNSVEQIEAEESQIALLFKKWLAIK